MSEDIVNDTTSQSLVAPSDIAEMAGVSRGAVSNWRKRAPDTFPQPSGGTPAKPLFARDAIVKWLSDRGYAVKKDHGESRIWSALNSMRGAVPPETVARIVLALACARKLDHESSTSQAAWAQIQGDVVHFGLDILTRVAHEQARQDPRWSHLTEDQRGDFTHIDQGAAQSIVQMMSEVAPENLAAITDYVLAKVARAQVRSGLEAGFVGSRTSEVLSTLAAAQGGRVLYDPACGIGTALVGAIDAGLTPERIVGHEINHGALQQVAQRAYLHDVDVELTLVDTLRDDPDPRLEADIIIAEPPISMKLSPSVHFSDPRWVFGAPTRRFSELTWIQHVIAHLAHGGRGFVITAPGVLFRGGEEKNVRTTLLQHGCVEAIIGLPARMLPSTSIPLAVWVLRTPASSGRSDVLFIDARDVPDAEKHVGDWFPALEGADIDVPHQRVDIRDILAADSSLSPSRWIHVTDRNPAEVVKTYQSSWKNLVRTLDLISGTSASLHHFAGTHGARIVTIGDLIDQGLLEVQQGRVKSSDLPDELAHRYITPAQIKNGQLPLVDDTTDVPIPLQDDLTEDGEVLVTTQGTVSAVVDDGGGHLLGAGNFRLRSTDTTDLSPHYLALVLAGSWNDRFQMGSGIGRADLRVLEIPLVPGPEQAHARLADMAVKLLSDHAHALLENAQAVRESMRDALRYNVTIPSDQ